MFARFDENPAMTLRVFKETKRYGQTEGRTDGQCENSIPPTNKVCGGYKQNLSLSPGLQIRVRIGKLFSLFLIQTYVVGTQKKLLNETVLLSTQNTCLN